MSKAQSHEGQHGLLQVVRPGCHSVEMEEVAERKRHCLKNGLPVVIMETHCKAVD